MADVAIAVVQFTSPGSTGTFDVTADPSQLGGLIPKAVIIFGGADDAGAGGTVDARYCVGFAAHDGGSPPATTQNEHYTASLDAATSTNTFSRWRSTHVLAAGSASEFIRASVSSWIPNGVRLNFDVAAVGGRRFTAVLIAGDDVFVQTGVIAPSGVNPTVTVDTTALVGTPDIVLFKSSLMNAASGTNVDQHGFGFGAATPSANYCASQLESDAIAAGGRPTAAVYDSHCHVWIAPASGLEGWRAACSNFSNGFDFNVTGTIGGDQIGYLAMRFAGDAQVRLFGFATPTSTGIRADTMGSPAFRPQFGLICAASPQAYDTIAFDTSLAASLGIGVFDNVAQGSHHMRIDPGVDPTDTAEETQASAFSLGVSAATGTTVAAFDEFTDTGWELDWTSVNGAANVGFAIAIETNFEAGPAAEVRTTQMFDLVGVLQTPPIRVTQMFDLVGVRLNRPGCDTREADLWRIERTDGTVHRFTSHNRAMTFRGEVYQPCGSLTTSALQLSAEIGSTDNVDLSGVIYQGGITELDIWSGRFVGAAVEIWRVSWGSGGLDPLLMTSGNVGSAKFADQPFTFEVITAGERLTQRAVLQPVMPTCRFKTFDSRCSLSAASFVETGTVTSVAGVNLFTGAPRREFYDTSRGEVAGYFTLGKLTWTGGANNGRQCDVKLFEAGGRFVLEERMAFAIQAGDTYSVLPGDDHTFETCRDKFANAINFGGFHKVKGNDDLQRPGNENGALAKGSLLDLS